MTKQEEKKEERQGENQKETTKEAKKEKVKKEKEKGSKLSWKTIFISVLLNLSILCGYHFLIVEKKCLKVKTFDFLGYMNLMQKLYLQKLLNDTDVAEITDEMKLFLEQEGKKRVLIVPKQFVLNDKDFEELKFNNKRLNKAFSLWEKGINASEKR